MDVDEAKVAAARRAAERAGVGDRVRFEVVAPGRRMDGQWDAIVCNDVLYLLGHEEAVDLVRWIAGSLAPRGTAVVKEMAEGPAWKRNVNQLQETVATRVLRYTVGEHVELVEIPTIVECFESAGLSTRVERLDAGYAHPHAAVVAHAGGGEVTGGDRSRRWRSSYRQVRKELLADDETTNRRRAAVLGLDRLPRGSALIDLGSGDGNLVATLVGLGFRRVVAVEYQAELAGLHEGEGLVAVGSITAVPARSGAFDAAIVMDVLHHLPADDWATALGEAARLVRPGGTLHVCEPADSMTRRVLSAVLFSPLGALTAFSRNKRAMVEAERSTLDPWLAQEHGADALITGQGFERLHLERRGLHLYGCYRRVAGDAGRRGAEPPTASVP